MPRRRSSASRRGSRPGADGPGVHRAEEPGPPRGSAHRLRGSRLPQHLRVLGRPRGDVPDRRRAVHPALRLLPDRHRQARRTRPRRAAPGRRERRDDGVAVLPPSPAWPATICPTAARGCTPKPCATSRSSTPNTGVELLIPDFNGEPALLEQVFEARQKCWRTTSKRCRASSSGSARRSATTAASRC